MRIAYSIYRRGPAQPYTSWRYGRHPHWKIGHQATAQRRTVGDCKTFRTLFGKPSHQFTLLPFLTFNSFHIHATALILNTHRPIHLHYYQAASRRLLAMIMTEAKLISEGEYLNLTTQCISSSNSSNIRMDRISGLLSLVH